MIALNRCPPDPRRDGCVATPFSQVSGHLFAVSRSQPQAIAGGSRLTKVDADLAPSAEQSTAQGPCCAAHLHPSGVAEGHEPLTMDRRHTAVLSAVFAARATP